MSKTADAIPSITVNDGRTVLGHIFDGAKGIIATDADGALIGKNFPNRAEAQAAIVEHAREAKA